MSTIEPYIICEIDEVGIFLNCARATAIKFIKELERYNLLMKLKRGQGLANLLYVAHVYTSTDTLKTHLKFHKRILNDLKYKREQQKQFYLLQKSKNCTPIENTTIENDNKLKAFKLLKSSKFKFNRVQKSDRKYTYLKDAEEVAVESTQSPNISLVKDYGFDVNDIQVKNTQLRLLLLRVVGSLRVYMKCTSL